MSRNVLVVDANAIGMIAVIRSLGRAGYRVHAISHQHDALGFGSRYTARYAVHPQYESPAFTSWLLDYIGEHQIDAVVCSEDLYHAIRPRYSDFQALVPDSPSDEALDICLSKGKTWRHLMVSSDTSKYFPESAEISNEQDIIYCLQSTKHADGCYLKLDKQYARRPGAQGRVIRVRAVDDFRDIAAACLKDYSKLTWQRHVEGLQVGVSLWRHKGQIVAENMVLGLHLYPYYAGNMSLRETWWNDRILTDAKAKLSALEWNGVAMMEYIWNPENENFWFVEVNPRFWGYLHVDLACDKDFPRWQMDAHFGALPLVSLGPPGYTVKLRYAPGEVIHIASRILSPRISLWAKLKSIANFLVLSFDPRVKADLWFKGDRRLYLYSWMHFFRDLPRRLLRIFGRQSH